MAVYVTSFGIDLSHKIAGNKTPHNSKNSKTEKGLIYVNVEKGYKFVNAEIIGSL